MRICIPVSAADKHMLPEFIEDLAHFGGLEQHHLLLVPTPSATKETQNARDALLQLCPQTRLVPTPNESHEGWPVASNRHFAEAAHIWVGLDPMPVLWMELDARPIQERWIDQIATALQNAGGTKYMGYVRETEYYNEATGGRHTPPGDDYMLGVAVYPHDLATNPTTLYELRDLRYGQGSKAPKDGFDWYLRMCIKRDHRMHSRLFGDQWNTGNYRVEEDRLVCDPLPAPKQAPHARNRGGIVDAGCVLVHGCKDSSLHQLIVGNQIPRFSLPAMLQGHSYGTLNPPQATGGDPLIQFLIQQQAKSDERAARQDALMLAMAEKLMSLGGASPAPAQSSPVPTVAISEAPAAISSAREAAMREMEQAKKAALAPEEGHAAFAAVAPSPKDRILEFMNGTSQTVKGISEALSLSKDEVIAIVSNCPEINYSGPPAGWCRPVHQEEAAA